MRWRAHRRNLVVWSSSGGSAEHYGASRLTSLPRRKRMRRFVRTSALLAVVGVMRLARSGLARLRPSDLERELAAFSTPAQRRDFEAALDRYPDSVTDELRTILAHQAVAS